MCKRCHASYQIVINKFISFPEAKGSAIKSAAVFRLFSMMKCLAGSTGLPDRTELVIAEALCFLKELKKPFDMTLMEIDKEFYVKAALSDAPRLLRPCEMLPVTPPCRMPTRLTKK